MWISVLGDELWPFKLVLWCSSPLSYQWNQEVHLTKIVPVLENVSVWLRESSSLLVLLCSRGHLGPLDACLSWPLHLPLCRSPLNSVFCQHCHALQVFAAPLQNVLDPPLYRSLTIPNISAFSILQMRQNSWSFLVWIVSVTVAFCCTSGNH